MARQTPEGVPWGRIQHGLRHREREVTSVDSNSHSAVGTNSDTPPAIVAATRWSRTHQSWVQAHIWNTLSRTKGLSIIVLVDTGAGGGNFVSERLIQAVQRTDFNGQNLASNRGRGFLRAANPADSGVAPMSIVGTTLLALIFLPVDRVFRVRFRVMHALPVGVILGTDFMYRHRSIITFEDSRSFKATPDAQVVPLLLPHAPPNTRLGKPEQCPGEIERSEAAHLHPMPTETKSFTPPEGCAFRTAVQT